MNANHPVAVVDTQALKQAVNLPEFAARYSALKRWSAGELAGPCPVCAGTDRFHVHADGWWKCYQCHPKPSDAIELVMWADHCDFKTACGRLDPAHRQEAGARQPVAAAPLESRRQWGEPEWQAAARRVLVAAVAALNSAQGEPARSYLLGRGILPATWTAWQIGYATPCHPAEHAARPALVLPWLYRGTIKALQYRFFGDGIHRRGRFGCRAGGERTLFGLDHLGGRLETLLLVEGELNALSLWQTTQRLCLDGIDVVSIGSETNVANPAAVKLAERYRRAGGRVVIWADEDSRVRQFIAAVPGAHGLSSPDGLDANDLLQRGLLDAFLPAALAASFPPAAGPVAVNQNVDPTADPRPDLAADSQSWAALLARAYECDGFDPYGVFGALQGARIAGARLVVEAGAGGSGLNTADVSAQDLGLLAPYQAGMAAFLWTCGLPTSPAAGSPQTGANAFPARLAAK